MRLCECLFSRISRFPPFFFRENEYNIYNKFFPVFTRKNLIMTPGNALPGGNETILIVDDQETVWDFLIEALQNLGYSVLLAENGEDAVSIYRENPHEIDLVLLDMVMPRLGGHGTFYQIKAIDPSAKILLSSGFVQPEATQDLLDNGAAGFLEKPHRLPTLTRAIRDILDGKTVGPIHA